MRTGLHWLPLVMALLIVPGCASPKKAAEQGLAGAEAAYARIARQAMNAAPGQARELEVAIAAARASLAQGDVKAALSAAEDLQARIKSLAEALPALEAKLREDWASLTNSVPGALAAVQRRLDEFGRPPAGMPERIQFDASSARLVQMGHDWEEAQSLIVSGKLAEAVALGERVRQGTVRMLTDMQTGS